MNLVCFHICKLESRWWLQAILKAALWTRVCPASSTARKETDPYFCLTVSNTEATSCLGSFLG